VVGDPDVNPEHYLTSELGLRGQAETVSGSVAGFYTQVDDLIVPAFTDASMGTSIATNAGDAVVYGVEVEAAWRFLPQWTLSGFAAWQDARTQSAVVLDRPFVDKPNSRQLPLSGSLALRWNDGSGKFWAEARVLGATKEDRITAEDQAADDQRIPTGGTPGYLVASLRAGWQVTSHLDLTCSLENVSDEDYRIHGSGQNESGLGGVVSVKMRG
jgi:hemoglobin/transferrin/lactoferrin receptor protein